MEVGASFTSFAQLEEAIEHLQDRESLSLYRRDSRTVEAAQKKGVKRASSVKQDLIYYSIHYACYHGGKKFSSRSKGSRPNHRYLLVSLQQYGLNSNTLCTYLLLMV